MNKLVSLTQPGEATKVAEQAPLEDPAKELLTADDSPKGYVTKLMEAELYADAVRFWAFALPPRNTVEWAMKCVQQMPTLVETPLQKAAIQATQTWLGDPSDDNRRKAHAAAEAVGVDQPSGCVAMSAFFSEGSLVPAALQPVAAPPQAGPTTAACAIILAAVIQKPENAPERYKSFLQMGQETIKDRGEPAPLTAPPPAAPTSHDSLKHPEPSPPTPKLSEPELPPIKPKRGWY